MSQQYIYLMFFGKCLIIIQRIGDLPFIRFFVFNATIHTRVLIHQIGSRVFISKRSRLGICPGITTGCTPGKVFQNINFKTCIDRINTRTFVRSGSLVLYKRIGCIEAGIQGRKVRISLCM